jgi:UDP-perosamine 4-acetyltransferase
VTIGSGGHIGTGATVIQGISIGPNSLVAAGAVVVQDVEEGTTVRGVPARVTIR